MKAMFKLWLDDNGKVFGKGPLLLLQGVEKSGSLSEAAKNLGMSYNKAHNLIKSMEKKTNKKFLIKKIGGANGGSSTLTPEAKKLIEIYEVFEKDCTEYINKAYEKHFGSEI